MSAETPDGGHRPPLQRAINLLPYQRRWVEDDSKLKIAVKARQIGYSFAATLRAVLKCLEHKTTWIFLSKGERQSRLLMEKVQDHIRTCGIVAQSLESNFFEGASLKQLEVRFPNGSVIYGLPANPDTARGYSGHVTLDEFAFHADADKIYAALFPAITRGYGLEVISTPNGTQGKFYELAKAAGLTEPGFATRDSGFGTSQHPGPLPPGEGVRQCRTGEGSRTPNPEIRGLPESRVPNPEPRAPTWSAHHCDIYDAVRQGLRIDINLLRSGCEDLTAWQQEFCCQFVSTSENFLSPELLSSCLSAEATTACDLSSVALASSRHAASMTTLSRQTAPLTELGSASAPPPSGFATRDSGRGSGDAGLGSNSSPLPLGEGGPVLSGPGEDTSPQYPAPSPEFFLGIDIGRHHDRTVFWLDEVAPPAAAGFRIQNSELRNLGVPSEICNLKSAIAGAAPSTLSVDRIAVARLVRTLDNVPFAEQLAAARELLSLTVAAGLSRHANGGVKPPLRGEPLIRRACIDATGIGAMLAETLQREFGPRVEPVVFTAAVKEDLAFRVKRRLEARLTLLPDTREIRRAFSAVKKFITPSGNVRFDAVRTEAGHADEFWAKALADLAADPEAHRVAAGSSDAFLADATPLVPPTAFREVDGNWSAMELM